MNDLDLMERCANDIVLSDFGPRLVVRNWDTTCASEFLTGKGFPIKNQKSFDSKFKKFDDGIHSIKFGTSWEDENAFKERYTCQCGYRKGSVYEHEICPECGTEVGYVDVDLGKHGWIVMKNKFKVINPAMFALLRKFIGKTALDKMLSFTKELDEDGHFIESTAAKDKYVSIGLTGFREKLFEILEYYRPKREKKDAYYWEILKKWDCIFVSAIPVYSNVLRPITTSPSEYHYTKAEQAFNVITGCVNKLNTYSTDIDESDVAAINELLYKIQQKVLDVDELTFKMMDKKTGHIHDGIFGGRMDFSARDVIVPDPTLRANEIKLSYLAVLELYKLEICNMITKINNCSYTAALKYWFDGHIKFNNFVYEIMIHLMNKTKYGMMCLINRNPKLMGRVGVN